MINLGGYGNCNLKWLKLKNLKSDLVFTAAKVY